MELQNIFEAITPDNIKNIPLVRSCMTAFISQLRRDGKVAEKISRLYDIDSTDYFYIDENDNRIVQKDSNVVRLSKENLKKGLVQFYLNVLYKLIEEAAVNKDVKTALMVRGYDSPILDSINKVFNFEYLGGFRYFQQSSGNREAINYIYEFSTYIERGYIVSDLNLTEVHPLHLEYEGSLHESMFTTFMKKMSHPAGWTNQYQTLLKIGDDDFVDYFGIALDVYLNYIMLDNPASDFPVIWYFYDLDEIKALLKTQVNHHTQTYYTDEELDNVEFIKIDQQPVIKTYTRRDVPCKQYDFSNGYTLYDNGCVYYLRTELFNRINWESQNEIDAQYILHRGTQDPIVRYLGYRLIPDININNWHFVYRDEFDIDFELFMGHTDDNYYFMEDDSNALNISGDSYHYITGYDEGFNNVTNYNNVINNFNNAYSLQISFDTYYISALKVYDDFGHGFIKTSNLTNREPQLVTVPVYYFDGQNLYIEIHDAENGKTYIYLNNVNTNFNETITNIDYSVINKLTITGSVTSSKTLKFASRSKTATKTVNGSFTHTFDVSACSENEDYTLTLGSLKIKSNLVQQESNRPNIKITQQSTFSQAIVTSAYTNKNSQKGIASGNGDTLYNYTLDNPDVYDNVYNTIIEGSLRTVNHKTDKMCTYINYGYRKNPSESIDCYIPCCTKYTEDDFYIEYYEAVGSYLVFDNDECTDNSVFYHPVGRYMYFRENNTVDNFFTEGYIVNEHSFTNKSQNWYKNKKTYEMQPLEESYYLTFQYSPGKFEPPVENEPTPTPVPEHASNILLDSPMNGALTDLTGNYTVYDSMSFMPADKNGVKPVEFRTGLTEQALYISEYVWNDYTPDFTEYPPIEYPSEQESGWREAAMMIPDDYIDQQVSDDYWDGEVIIDNYDANYVTPVYAWSNHAVVYVANSYIRNVNGYNTTVLSNGGSQWDIDPEVSYCSVNSLEVRANNNTDKKHFMAEIDIRLNVIDDLNDLLHKVNLGGDYYIMYYPFITEAGEGSNWVDSYSELTYDSMYYDTCTVSTPIVKIYTLIKYNKTQSKWNVMLFWNDDGDEPEYEWNNGYDYQNSVKFYDITEKALNSQWVHIKVYTTEQMNGTVKLIIDNNEFTINRSAFNSNNFYLHNKNIWLGIQETSYDYHNVYAYQQAANLKLYVWEDLNA